MYHFHFFRNEKWQIRTWIWKYFSNTPKILIKYKYKCLISSTIKYQYKHKNHVFNEKYVFNPNPDVKK